MGNLLNAKLLGQQEFGANGMVHGFDVNPSTGVLTWTAGVAELYDGNFEPLNDAVIVGTDDMTFSVDTEGHLIMTIDN
jgi:hypothetical protein